MFILSSQCRGIFGTVRVSKLLLYADGSNYDERPCLRGLQQATRVVFIIVCIRV